MNRSLRIFVTLATLAIPFAGLTAQDFRRDPATSTPWVLGHIRAGQAVFEAEIIQSGFEKIDERPDLLEENYFVVMHERIKSGRGLRYWDELFAEIFENHASIRMEVQKTASGVKVIETSDQPSVAALIQAHADAVSQFVKRGFDEAHKNHPVPRAAPNADPER